MNSNLGHRQILLDKAYVEVGIGVRPGTYGGHAGTNMYTVDFGVR